MDDSEVHLLGASAIDELQQAAWVTGSDDRRARGFNVAQLAVEKLVGHLGLDEIVNAGAAAAPGAFREINQFKVWNRAQKLTRLCGDFLAMGEMAGFMIRDDA